MTPEGEGVGDDGVAGEGAGAVGDVIEVAFGIGMAEVDGGGDGSACDGEGVLRKGQAKLASDELKRKVKMVEAMIADVDDLAELEHLEAALTKRTVAALDEVLPKSQPPALEAPAAAPAEVVDAQ